MTLPGRAVGNRIAQLCSWLLLASAWFGFIILSRLPLRILQVFVAWEYVFTRHTFPQALSNPTAESYQAALAPLERMVASDAWLWPLLAALGFLLGRTAPLPPFQRSSRLQLALAVCFVLVGFSISAQNRLGPLVNNESALTWTMDYDEGVYVGFAREWAHGSLPYRDMWVSHPPTGIALLVPAVAASPNGEAALVNTRRLTAALDLMAALLLIWVGAQLVSPAVGVLAACVYLLDLVAGRNSTHVWLETGLNLWSLLALGCLLRGMRYERSGWFAAAGVFALLAATTKYTGAALGLAALATLVLAGRWRWAGMFATSGVVAAFAYALLVLPLGWRELLQQTLVAQVLRPPDDIPAFVRLDAALHTPASLLTVCGAAIGVCIIALRRPEIRLGWMLVFAWLAISLALLIQSPTFYDHYATQLVAPLALLAGACAVAWPRTSPSARAPAQTWRGAWRAPLGVVLLALPLVIAQQAQPEIQRSDDVVVNARAMKARVPSGQAVITFEPLYNLLADRPFARAPDQRLLIDSYMHLRYIQVDWASLTWPQTIGHLWSRGALPQQTWPNASALMLEQGQSAMFDSVRVPRTKAEFVALAGNYRALTLPTASLYQRVSTPRRFVAGSVRMRGVLLPTTVHAATQLPVAMFWQKLAPDLRLPMVSLQLVNSAGQKIGQYDKPIGPAEAGLQAWPVGPNTYQDDIVIPIAASTVPGDYALLMVVYDPTNGQRWPLANEQGQPLGEVLVVDTVTVTDPALR